MSTRELLASATARLAEAGALSPEADARLLLAHAAGVSGLALLPELDDNQRAEFEELVRGRAAGRPVQHLTGRAWFRYISVAVGPGVFVPRPETEVMTGWAIDRLRELIAAGTPNPTVVELCAGSAAISLAIADEVPAARLVAVELSPAAIEWARGNVAGTEVDLRQGDLADPLPDLDGRADLVIANPPYIPLEAWESVSAEVRDHDPEIALFSGADGLDAIRVLAHRAADLLRPGGWFCVEHAEANAEATVHTLLEAGRWERVRDRVDLAGRRRFATAVSVAGLDR